MATEVKSEMTGTVWQIEVEVGDEVAEDDELIILESMKMEIPIHAPTGGTVAELLVEEGDPIDEDQVVAKID